MAMSAMMDTADRQNGVDADTGKKVGAGVDFVDYFTAGVSIYTPKGKTQNIKTWADLCGKKIAVQRGTVSEDLAKSESKKCTGGKKIAIESCDDNDQQAQTRVRAGGADAGSSDFPVAANAVKTSGGGKDFELVGEQVEAAPYGIAVAESNTQLRDALAGRARRDHQERRVRQGDSEVGRRGRRRQDGRGQRRKVTAGASGH